jgi:hypothetical protein
MSDPEISIGSGRSRIVFRGPQAIRAAGWTLKMLLLAKAIRWLLLPIIAYAALNWFSAFPGFH